MVNVSKKYLNESLRQDIWREFKLRINSNKSPEETLRKYFTPDEIVMIEKRLAIDLLLKEGNSYREIGRKIDVSPATISYIKQGFKINKRK